MAKTLLVLVTLILLLSDARSQAVDTLLSQYNKKVPQEKTYVQFDNSVYLPGETVWYKGYLMIGNEPSWLSSNLYIDWCDEKGNLVKRTVSPVLGFSASGSFTIPHDLKGNTLQAIAYTRWMLNFDSSFLFRKTLTLAQPETSPEPVQDAPTLVFLPEGGDMMEGIPSYVAFKASLPSGMPVNVEGVIASGSGQRLGSFHSWHNGMGKLQLTPVHGEEYFAEWQTPDGIQYRTALPKAKTSGLVLSIANVSGARIFSVERAPVLEERFKRVSVVGTMNQQVVFRATAPFTEKTKLVSTLPVKDLPTGILQFTVFDVNQQPVAERILFVNNHAYESKPLIFHDSINTDRRARNIFEMEIPDTSLASLSLSVIDGDGAYDSSSQIITHFLLSGELKGYIHNPAYYFSDKGDSAAAALDLVMLTNGWRRFRWEHVFAGTAPSTPYQADTGFISLSGQVKQGRNKEENIGFLISSTDSTEQLFYLPIRPGGSFETHRLLLFDSAKLFLMDQGASFKMNKPLVADNHFLPQAKTTKWASYTRPSSVYKPQFLQDIARQRSFVPADGTTLKEVIVRARPKTRSEELNELYASPLYNAVDAIQLNALDDPNASSSLTVFHYLEGKVAGLRAYNIYSTSVKPEESLPVIKWRGEEIIFMLNEMPTDARTMLTLPMSQVAMIKLFRNSFFGYKTGAAGNVAVVYTKKGGDMALDTRPGLSYAAVQGYTPVKEFYSPDYSQPVPANTKDQRRTLLWQPNITTGGGNRIIKVSFYNNDTSHSFRVIAEGITVNGKLIHVNRLFKQ